MTVSALLSHLRRTLRSYGVANPDVEAETIAGHVLGLRRSRLYLEPDRAVEPAERARILEIAGERRRRFPLQYLLGEVEFFGLPLSIKQGVFIPRPETEILLEAVIARAKGAGRMSGPKGAAGPGWPGRVLDLGTGSGALAVALARHLGPELVVAVDVSPEAAALARANARLNRVAEVVTVVVGDALECIGSGEAFDLVVANPPYVATAEMAGLQPEVRDFEPRLALDGGAEGLDFIAGVLPRIPSILRKGSIVAFEIGAAQGEAVSEHFRGAGLGGVEVVKDLAGRDRVVLGTWSGQGQS